MFYAFDKLILMADGCMVYTGPPSKCLAYLAKVGYVPPADYNPADFLMDLVTSTEAGASHVVSGDTLRAADATNTTSGTSRPLSTTTVATSAAAPTTTSAGTALAGYEPVNSDDVEKAAKSIRTILIDAWDNAPIEAEIAAACSSFTDTKDNASDDDINNVKYLASYKTQFTTLFERAMLNSKSVLLTNLTVLQSVAVALICGALWWRMPYDEKRVSDRSSFIFFFMTYWFFSTLFYVSNLHTAQFLNILDIHVNVMHSIRQASCGLSSLFCI